MRKITPIRMLLAFLVPLALFFAAGCEPSDHYDDNDDVTYIYQTVPDHSWYQTHPVFIMQGDRYVRVYTAPPAGTKVYTKSSSGSYSVNSSFKAPTIQKQVPVISNRSSSGSTWTSSSSSGTKTSAWRPSSSSSTRSSSSMGSSWSGSSSRSSSMGSSWGSSSSRSSFSSSSSSRR